MSRLKVENAWVEFPISLKRIIGRPHMSRTGGQIDSTRGVVTALRDISFELREGDRLGLMGHNGAGKTTMLRLLAGAYPPTRGRLISVGSISTLFNATPGLNVDGTGRENLITCGLHLGLSKKQINAKMDEIIDFAELGDYIDLPVRIYSSGMMTRLGFSIATAVEPEILLLDEGLATGDAHFARKAEGKMNDLIARSSILVIASHSETMLAKMCSRGLLLEHGRIIADGPAKNLLETYRNSIIESARADNAEGLQRAYVLATDMARDGEAPPLELEEQGLRYALKLAPDDSSMWQRYVNVLVSQGKPVEPQIEVRMILIVLSKNPSRADLKDRLKDILAISREDLPDDLRERAVSAAGIARADLD
jgi:ABC-2 type transport system ATP-binding protein